MIESALSNSNPPTYAPILALSVHVFPPTTLCPVMTTSLANAPTPPSSELPLRISIGLRGTSRLPRAEPGREREAVAVVGLSPPESFLAFRAWRSEYAMDASSLRPSVGLEVPRASGWA
jgi:hypothetical protein